jgi:FKBP-type peptidyl-prolyl cis-trans isomerase
MQDGIKMKPFVLTALSLSLLGTNCFAIDSQNTMPNSMNTSPSTTPQVVAPAVNEPSAPQVVAPAANEPSAPQAVAPAVNESSATTGTSNEVSAPATQAAPNQAISNQPATPPSNPMEYQTIQQPQAAASDPGEAFLAANKLKPDVITLPDGLQYKVIKEGMGQKPTLDDTVTVNYVGTFIDGREFDSSYKRNKPATFPVTGVIPGWTEALQMMSVGSVWELYIPASLAYGATGAPPIVGPNQVLIFKVELLGVNQPAEELNR